LAFGYSRRVRPQPDVAPEGPSTARNAFVATAVAVAVVVSALALWKLKVVIALLFSAVTIAAAMRPGVEWLAARRVPRWLGVLLHYLALLGLLALFLSFVVPPLISQVESALSSTKGHHGGGVKGQILDALQKRLLHLPSASKLLHPALSVGKTAFEVLIGIFFTFASAAYWLFERDRAVDLVASLIPRPERKKVRDTWYLIDMKLGAFVRGQLLLIMLVATAASLGLWAVGEPYFLLVGIAVGLLEIVPVIGPIAAIVLAAGAGLTTSWHIAVYATALLLAIRLLEDYLVTPRVLGGAVGLSPLVVLVSVSATGILLGAFYVLIAIPIASLLATLIDVIVRDIDPAEVDVPTVLFPAKDTEA
jgi:predicted PurR-regulated permease PerM